MRIDLASAYVYIKGDIRSLSSQGPVEASGARVLGFCDQSGEQTGAPCSPS